MRNIGFFSLLTIFFSYYFCSSYKLGQTIQNGYRFCKGEEYSDAVSIFEELAKNDEYDAQYNLAFLISTGKGITKNYSEALFWAYLSFLGKIEKAEDLAEDLKDVYQKTY